MSADNGLIVTRLHRRSAEPVSYGIFYYSGDFDPPGDYYCEDNTENNSVFMSPVRVIVAAHKMQNNIQTEYGVYVHSLVISDALEHLDWLEERAE